MTSPPIQRALISVSDKTGLAEFARALSQAGVQIYSTGGTGRYLEEHGVPVCDVSSYTGFPEMMHGRLKTLHPKIFGGILARRDQNEDLQAMAEHGIESFELVVVNLYPFAATIAKPGVTTAEAIEQIDIGGPSLVRAAAKNHAFVSIATSPLQYASILDHVLQHGATTFELRKQLAGEAFAHTAAYDRAIAHYFAHAGKPESEFLDTVSLVLSKKMELRYGENPHQKAALYRESGTQIANLVSAHQLSGKELSYNNLLDLDSALGIVRSFSGPAAVVIKHNNPCGAATASSLALAAGKALEGDPQSAFGGIIGFNTTVDEATAELLATPGLFIEAIIAPDFSAGAVGILTSKPKWKANVRLMQVGELHSLPAARHYRFIDGGMLAQDADVLVDEPSEWKVVTEQHPSEIAWNDLKFAWSMVRHVKSNAITVCKDTMLLGAGAGQMSRVDSVEIALSKAGSRSSGAVLASDAFFPFPDSIDRAAKSGITAIIQPGGSVKDGDVIEACNRHGIAMVFTGRRHFKH